MYRETFADGGPGQEGHRCSLVGELKGFNKGLPSNGLFLELFKFLSLTAFKSREYLN